MGSLTVQVKSTKHHEAKLCPNEDSSHQKSGISSFTGGSTGNKRGITFFNLAHIVKVARITQLAGEKRKKERKAEYNIKSSHWVLGSGNRR